MPQQIRHDLDLVIDADPAWTGQTVPWRGIDCPVGRARMWLNTRTGHYPGFSLLVLLPSRTPPDLPPFILLGAQFLCEFAATAELTPAAGQLLIP